MEFLKEITLLFLVCVASLVVGMGFIYVLAVFVSLEPDVTQWPEQGRLLYLVFCILPVVLLFMFFTNVVRYFR